MYITSSRTTPPSVPACPRTSMRQGKEPSSFKISPKKYSTSKELTVRVVPVVDLSS